MQCRNQYYHAAAIPTTKNRSVFFMNPHSLGISNMTFTSKNLLLLKVWHESSWLQAALSQKVLRMCLATLQLREGIESPE